MRRSSSAYRILYDADCGICSRAVLWLKAQSIREPVEWLPVGSDEAQRLLPNRLPDEMAVVGPGGEVWVGADGVRVCLWLAGYTGTARILMAMRSLAGLGYRIVARNRAKLSKLLGYDACRISG